MFRAGSGIRAGRAQLRERRGCGVDPSLSAKPLAPFRVQTRLNTWRPRPDHALTRGHQRRTHGASQEHRSREHSGPRESPRSHRRVLRPPLPGSRVLVRKDGEAPEAPRRLSRGARPRLAPTRLARTHRGPAHHTEAPPLSAAPGSQEAWPHPTCMDPPPAPLPVTPPSRRNPLNASAARVSRDPAPSPALRCPVPPPLVGRASF